jgi:hypothetical protein
MNQVFKDQGFIRLLALFVVVSAAVLILHTNLEDKNIDPWVVGVGNAIIFLASLLALSLYGRAKRSKSNHGFTRNIYAAFVTKFFILLTSAMVYFYFASEISSKAIFVCLGLYLIYHFVGASYAARVEKKHVKQH